MKIKVIAIAPNDGWAFILKEDKIFLIRPPYISTYQIEVTGKDIENAIHLHGFDKCDFTFNNITEVIKFLKDKYIETKNIQGLKLPSSEELKELLNYATGDVVLEYFNKIKNKLIPEGKLNAAESLILNLMRTEKVKNNPQMLKKGTELLLQACMRRSEMEKLETEISDNQREFWPDRFPNAVNRYTVGSIIKRQKAISARGHLLQMSSARD